MKRYSILFICLALFTTLMSAHDFTISVADGKLCFKITDAKSMTAEVTYEGSIAKPVESTLTGALVIPGTVRHEGNVYTITSIGAKALAGAKNITSVTMPSTISSIGDFAFEGCTGLENIIFPGSPVAFGQGVFFRCTALRNISIGSDWTQLDFRMFRWSENLQSVNIPARIQKIQGLKSLRHLRSIEVDANNVRYAAEGGCLYDKSFTTLLCVPRAFSGELSVRLGVTSILWGAVIDCPGITAVSLPSTLQKLSFREFSRIPNLMKITCQTESPVITATSNGTGDLPLLAVANGKVELYVPKASVKAWKSAITQQGGDFYEIRANKPEGISENEATMPYSIATSQLILAKNIKPIK